MNCFGIDLGTTNSAISCYNGVDYRVIELEGGGTTLPSCVMMTGEDSFVVGKEAYNQRGSFVNEQGLSNVCYSVKRLMGTSEIVKLVTPDGVMGEFTPSYISSLILKELVKRASYAYDDIHKVVITVPAYFTQTAIKNTVEAGTLAGLEVLAVLQEPTSAVLAYTTLKQENINMKGLVYDLGGGTFDVSLVDISKVVESNKHDTKYTDFFSEMYNIDKSEINKDKVGVTDINVISIEGNSRLGGDDIDLDTLDIFLEKAKNKGIDIKKFTRQQLEQFKIVLERDKKSLAKYSIPINVVGSEKLSDAVYIDMNLSDFAQGVINTYAKTKEKIYKVLSKISTKDLKKIILVGGSTKSPFIRRSLSKDFPYVDMDCFLNPDESVAIGASIKSYILQNKDSNINIKDVLPISIGVKVDDKVKYLIAKDTQFPVRETIAVATSYDNQDVVIVDIYQGESRMAEECTLLGQLQIDNIPKAKAGEFPIGVTLQITSTGRLRLYVKIQDKVYEKEIINLLTSAKNTVNKKDSVELLTKEDKLFKKKIIRWNKYSESLSEDKAKQFKCLLGMFENCKGKDKNIEEQIVSFIKDNPLERKAYIAKSYDVDIINNEETETKKNNNKMKFF